MRRRRNELSFLRPSDVMRVGGLGLRARKVRTLLTALGIAIGIAAMVAVLGITASEDAQVQAELNALGPNLLEVLEGESITGDEIVFPVESADMIERIGPIEIAAQISTVDATVRRTEFIPEAQTGGIAVVAADADILEVVGGTVEIGSFLDSGDTELPLVVLGSVAADRMGVRDLDSTPIVFLSGIYFEVIGVLDPIRLAPGLDRAALIGSDIAVELFDAELAPQTIYVEVVDGWIDDVRSIIGPTIRPDAPDEVTVTRPSDAIEAREVTSESFRSLLLGLGAVALLVGGVGIANVMVISVLERQSEIGVRRALGATRRHVRRQFVVEAAMLSLLGGVSGVALGAVITMGYARREDSVVEIPIEALGLGVGAALVIGALAGLYPAARAARLDPAEAVRPG
jgi:putative ABC transport system permease protein